jgi:hypothetical protein
MLLEATPARTIQFPACINTYEVRAKIFRPGGLEREPTIIQLCRQIQLKRCIVNNFDDVAINSALTFCAIHI